MTKDGAKAAHVLLNYYKSLFTQKYKISPAINIYRDKWAMIDVIDSVGIDEAKNLLDYYFRTSKAGHPLTFFFYNFDKLAVAREQAIKDQERTERLLKESKERVNEESTSKQPQ